MSADRRFGIGFQTSIIAQFVGVVLFVGLALDYLVFSRVTAITHSAASVGTKSDQCGIDKGRPRRAPKWWWSRSKKSDAASFSSAGRGVVHYAPDKAERIMPFFRTRWPAAIPRSFGLVSRQ
jgi:hypothetical protein